MSKMNEIEFEYCRQFLDKIKKHPLSVCYLKPVDPIKDQATDYFKVISDPMDLGTISHKLDDHQYSSTEEFKYDVNLVWSNSMKYLKKKTILLYQVAQHMKDKCDKLLQNIPKTKAEEWAIRMQAANKKLNKHLSLAIPQESLVPRKPEYTIT